MMIFVCRWVNILAKKNLGLRPRVKGYIENVVRNYNNEEFRSNFRMSRDTFNYLKTCISQNISTPIESVARHTYSAKEQRYIGLWRFGTHDSYRSICGRFDIGKATGIRIIKRITDALIRISPTVIKWPEDDYLEAIKNSFGARGFPDTIGVIDGCHITVPQPKEHGLSYINRKGFASLVLQGVCDHEMKFIHCYTGELGSSHDARVLRNSDLWQYILDNNKFPRNTHLIGDKVYPLLGHLMTPYRDNGHLTPPQLNFNYHLCAVRSIIDFWNGHVEMDTNDNANAAAVNIDERQIHNEGVIKRNTICRELV